MQSIHGLAIHSPESNKSSRWILMDLVQQQMQSIHGLALYTVMNPTKAAGGVWWIRYSSKCKASMAWLYTVLNPPKAAGGVWWIRYSSKCKASMAWLFTQSWIQQKQPVEFDGFGTHGKTCSIRWAILWSAESIKIRQNQGVDFNGLGIVRALCFEFKDTVK